MDLILIEFSMDPQFLTVLFKTTLNHWDCIDAHGPIQTTSVFPEMMKLWAEVKAYASEPDAQLMGAKWLQSRQHLLKVNTSIKY